MLWGLGIAISTSARRSPRVSRRRRRHGTVLNHIEMHHYTVLPIFRIIILHCTILCCTSTYAMLMLMLVLLLILILFEPSLPLQSPWQYYIVHYAPCIVDPIYYVLCTVYYAWRIVNYNRHNTLGTVCYTTYRKLHCLLLCDTAWLDMIWYGVTQYDMIQKSKSTIPYNQTTRIKTQRNSTK